MPVRECQRCDFWIRDAQFRGPERGECTRNAPLSAGNKNVGEWPYTRAEDGCGEFQDKNRGWNCAQCIYYATKGDDPPPNTIIETDGFCLLIPGEPNFSQQGQTETVHIAALRGVNETMWCGQFRRFDPEQS